MCNHTSSVCYIAKPLSGQVRPSSTAYLRGFVGSNSLAGMHQRASGLDDRTPLQYAHTTLSHVTSVWPVSTVL